MRLYLCVAFGLFRPIFGEFVLVATGTSNLAETNHVEIIDTATLESCNFVPSVYPDKISAASPMTFGNKSVVCFGDAGDFATTGTCRAYNHENDLWETQPYNLANGHKYVLSEELSPGYWLFMGGSSGYSAFDTVHAFIDGIFVPRRRMPEAVSRGSSAVIDPNTVLVAGALFDQQLPPSRRNFIYDVRSDNWREVAERKLPASDFHVSGTFFNSTAGEYQVATIGEFGIEIYSPSGESWHRINYPSDLTFITHAARVQQGRDLFLLFGGKTPLQTKDVFLFDESGLQVLKKEVLKIAMTDHVAVAIPDASFSCA